MLTIDEFTAALGDAAWGWNLTRFCQVLGWEEDAYAEEKFVQFQELARLLGQFDRATLTTILRARGLEV